jgi:hypothetical protein
MTKLFENKLDVFWQKKGKETFPRGIGPQYTGHDKDVDIRKYFETEKFAEVMAVPQVQFFDKRFKELILNIKNLSKPEYLEFIKKINDKLKTLKTEEEKVGLIESLGPELGEVKPLHKKMEEIVSPEKAAHVIGIKSYKSPGMRAVIQSKLQRSPVKNISTGRIVGSKGHVHNLIATKNYFLDLNTMEMGKGNDMADRISEQKRKEETEGQTLDPVDIEEVAKAKKTFGESVSELREIFEPSDEK